MLPPYGQVNASRSHGFDPAAVGPVEVRLSVLNLLDRSYAIRDGTGIGVGAPQYAPRRTLYLGLTRSF